MVFEVTKLKDLNTIIIPFIEKYNCYSSRKDEFTIFKNVVKKMCDKTHLNKQGLKEIVNIVFDNSKTINLYRKYNKQFLFSKIESI